jgi:hypothetical protein
MIKFLEKQLERKRADPGDDMLTYWVDARDAEGNSLSPAELMGLAFVVLVSGYDTTVGQIGGTLVGLLSNPEKLAELRADPDLLPGVIEEFLRYHGSVHTGIRRFATEDLSIGGETVKAGETLLLAIGAADRDPQPFENPDAIDFGRPNNRRHLAFGNGPHVCPGSELGRMEVSIAVETTLRRFPDLRLAVPPAAVPWRPAYFVRVPLELPVIFSRTAATTR